MRARAAGVHTGGAPLFRFDINGKLHEWYSKANNSKKRMTSKVKTQPLFNIAPRYAPTADAFMEVLQTSG
ncbi:hypothetical protein SERLA73DRAFT_180794 [Serpula lacrymans var. lacrymans S7.3]|uniref:Uncharacterized protein n=2 Tax=Serpula lacrymans var. lacrymans TaxID=341189 RepID=F8PWG7_SERL3|nr:uncharacterized protein SERLADRAFT_466552 [Serpula lacrymans var. lacrymans S7.9]EGO00291.1 hypothetical protein SERLA73DRAFT_180794 [Serpula lacrymans var. lacrymans S7.3]EGO25850.1 hypothetical protein SERLADRAFT_466552 [Serpula lacrymans var. lacrymans S7.9]